ncbi:MAG: hypothetical protein KF889_25400 [Alphaproteobacteria bacterium]|nr:hypothetical protein [Alphaproteobacteria bacterium]MCW5739670.1 hypothetical protein [Alphaproteobacteria bacterium]
MASIVAICNLALSRLGTRDTIASLDEASVEARICKANYTQVRDELLREFDWNFARRVETLALRSETAPTGWSYVYSVPNKCARFRGIWSGPRLTGAPVDWQLGGIADGSGNDVVAIFTNQSQAEGVYTRIVENSELFSAGFVKALSWRLAEAIALPITNKESLADAVARRAQARIAEAMASEANEGVWTTDHQVPDFLQARGYSG